MKNIFKLIFLISLLVCTVTFRKDISNFLIEKVIYRNSNTTLIYNNYYNSNDYLYVQNIDNFKADNKQDLLNIIYTIINSGENDFIISCDSEYERCLEDVKTVAYDTTLLSDINNFVHPYNSFKTISIDINNSKKIRVIINHLYTDDQIEYVNQYIQDFINKNINPNMSDIDKIKVFHDYIVNNTSYDEEAAERIKNDKDSTSSAYTLITTNKSICSGYSDIMAIYLNTLKIPNYKIPSESHVWNLVYVNNQWLHLDLTWDDPIISNGTSTILHDYFLINTSKLHELDKKEHNFNSSIYLEAK